MIGSSSSKETLLILFFNAPISFHLLLLFFNFSSIFLANTCDDDDDEVQHEDGFIVEEDHEDHHYGFFSFEYMEKEDHLVADIIHGGESLLFLPIQSPKNDHQIVFDEAIVHDVVRDQETIFEEDDVDIEESMSQDPSDEKVLVIEEPSPEYFSQASESEHSSGDDVMIIQEAEPSIKDGDSLATTTTTSSVVDPDPSENGFATPIQIDLNNSGPVPNDDTASEEECHNKESKDQKNTIETKMSEDGKFFVLETKKFQVRKDVVEEIFGDSCTEGSTSKSSSEWRNSINYRDSGTEDPFSSSSRRSCPTWESYAVFRKYDEEMLFFDRISAQKLSETESLRAIEVCPRSISQRIVHKLTTKNKKSHDLGRRNPYLELETAYVAQICLTWEALNWNYKNFQRLKATRREEDPGCPGQIAQQFQQFQVLLQRFIENEPYEHGRRPEVYARMRISAPNLLQVPEFRDSEDDQKKAGFNITVSSIKFGRVIEDAIRTFMNFLKADKETPCYIFKAFFKRNHKRTVDPTYLNLMRKSNKRKKMKIKDLRRARKCIRKRKLKEEDEMEILMSLIDLKVVSRVLRMTEISDEQLHWCEEKMNKVRVWEGKLQRDSSPLFFPTH
ncbi:Ribosomal protein L34Ae [Macleaya cordata]|uniref:Ribosomal protein L34Ae n=1 Tax=Macleaya cordata TaxID=56857 RepID=A0A200PXN1_MACCD|nr:Ribosomal protein L34Ae [Macleaya cordata]